MRKELSSNVLRLPCVSKDDALILLCHTKTNVCAVAENENETKSKDLAVPRHTSPCYTSPGSSSCRAMPYVSSSSHRYCPPEFFIRCPNSAQGGHHLRLSGRPGLDQQPLTASAGPPLVHPSAHTAGLTAVLDASSWITSPSSASRQTRFCGRGPDPALHARLIP